MSEEMILEELKKQSNRLSNIEMAVNAIATQQVEISHIQASMTKLWEKHDRLVADNGVINRLEVYQASCPRIEFRESINSLNTKFWGLLTSVVLLVIGSAIKYILT